MYRVFSSPAIEWAHLVQQALQNHGIASILRNEQLARTEGGAPFYVEVWVQDAEQAREAEQVVRALLAEEEPGEDQDIKELWRCADCGEEIEQQFTSCWQCGWSRL